MEDLQKLITEVAKTLSNSVEITFRVRQDGTTEDTIVCPSTKVIEELLSKYPGSLNQLFQRAKKRN